ncbi:MAG: hypothetical protein DME25_19105 [Verrucomicrobia bacterium]|nr:MAG: hypothetical protein DME25_19105 [Verrucomicrobiota bacterium]
MLAALAVLLASVQVQAKLLDEFNDNVNSACSDTPSGGPMFGGGRRCVHGHEARLGRGLDLEEKTQI